MLSMTMLNEIHSHICSIDVITIKTNWSRNCDAQIIQKLMNFDNLSNSVAKSMILNFYGKLGDSRLLLRSPRNEVETKIHSIPSGGAIGVLVANPISTRACNHYSGRRSGMEWQIMLQSTLQLTKSTLDDVEVSSARRMHKLGNNMYCIYNIRSSHC